MIRDCIKMFSAAFCRRDKVTLNVLPEQDVLASAQFINLLSGRCDINTAKGRLVLKPLKKFPAEGSTAALPQMEKALFFLVAGLVAQMGLTVKIQEVCEAVSEEEQEHLVAVTQNTLAMSCRNGAYYLSSMLLKENPLFSMCEIPAFAAGLCLGAVLARASTLVEVPSDEKGDLLRFTLECLEADGALIYPDSATGQPIVKSLRKHRFNKAGAAKTTDSESFG